MASDVMLLKVKPRALTMPRLSIKRLPERLWASDRWSRMGILDADPGKKELPRNQRANQAQ
jgi:hypothetical protein